MDISSSEAEDSFYEARNGESLTTWKVVNSEWESSASLIRQRGHCIFGSNGDSFCIRSDEANDRSSMINWIAFENFSRHGDRDTRTFKVSYSSILL